MNSSAHRFLFLILKSAYANLDPFSVSARYMPEYVVHEIYTNIQ